MRIYSSFCHRQDKSKSLEIVTHQQPLQKQKQQPQQKQLQQQQQLSYNIVNRSNNKTATTIWLRRIKQSLYFYGRMVKLFFSFLCRLRLRHHRHRRRLHLCHHYVMTTFVAKTGCCLTN